MLKPAALALATLLWTAPAMAQDIPIPPRAIPMSDIEEPVSGAKPVGQGTIISSPVQKPLTALQASSAGNVPPAPSPEQVKADVEEKRLHQLFDEIDKDHNGKINEAEYSAHFKTTQSDASYTAYGPDASAEIGWEEFLKRNTVVGKIIQPKE